MIIPLPATVRQLAGQNEHPGLLLDKYAASWSDALTPGKLSADVQLPTIREVARLSAAPPSGLDFSRIVEQRRMVLESCGATFLEAVTTGPLTLHLSRASALENAGICLHRTYGFTYLPGTGIKGMVRAWAETVWRPVQPDQNAAWRSIEDVFGWAHNPDRRKQIDKGEIQKRFRQFSPLNDNQERPAEQTENSGRVVFHDAWPTKWPRLMVDILNSHHPKYYSGKPDHQPPPGDWEEPIPVYFLAVETGIPFSFALSPRRAGDAEQVRFACQCLVGALEQLGTGAKTNAGYGCFQVRSVDPAARDIVDSALKGNETAQHRRSNRVTLTLTTPAFLAGASPEYPDSCKLRPATLRGQLRWWWRTLHAAHLKPAELKRLEAAIWGDTRQGGAVRVSLVAADEQAAARVQMYDRKGIIDANRLPPPPTQKTTQGLIYASYGMDERKSGTQYRRPWLQPGASWNVSLRYRGANLYEPDPPTAKHPSADRKVAAKLTAEDVEHQVLAAVELLCRFGGVGSKSRKGFGCLNPPPELDLVPWSPARRDELLNRSSELRKRCKLPSGKSESPALDDLLETEPIVTPWTNYWMALDRTADAAQSFAQSMKHDVSKQALGLPRNIRPPYKGKFHNHPEIRSRHASPIHYHIAPDASGKFVVQIVAFPAHRLPDHKTSRDFLDNALKEIRERLVTQTTDHAKSGQSRATASRSADARAVPPALTAKTAKPGDWITGRLATEKSKSGGWKATYGSLTGPIQNTGDVPSDCQSGQEVELIVRIATAREIAFRWPTPADKKSNR